MNISGIRPYVGFYDYNSIKTAEIRNQQISASQSKEDTASEQEDNGKQAAMTKQAPEQKYTSFDYAQNYNPGEIYELKGVDSDINSLDVMKVISDLDKDQVLRQYQYFVGDKDAAAARMQTDQQERIFRSVEKFFL